MYKSTGGQNNDDLMTLIVNSVRNDFMTGDDISQSLALAACANLGGVELAETLSVDVQRLLTKDRTRNIVVSLSFWITVTAS